MYSIIVKWWELWNVSFGFVLPECDVVVGSMPADGDEGGVEVLHADMLAAVQLHHSHIVTAISKGEKKDR